MNYPAMEASAFQALARRREDARRSRGGLKCTPPNVKCGDRCIPPNWTCRRNGKGLDTHSKAARFDPVKGTASVIKGVKDLTAGALTLNVQRYNTGKNALSRGLTKLNPDPDLKRKQELRQRIDDWLIPMTSFGLLAMGVASGHRALKLSNVGGYRTGLGARIDRTATRAVNQFWDRVPGVSERRATRAALTSNAFTGFGRAGRTIQQRAIQTSRSPRESNILSGIRRQSALGNRRFSEIDTLARNQNLSFEGWQKARSKGQIGMIRAGKSVYAEGAASDFLASSLRLTNRTRGAVFSKDEVIISATRELTSARQALSAAFSQRNMRISSRADQDKFWSEQSATVTKQLRGLSSTRQATATSNAKSLYRELLSKDPESVAKRMWNEAFNFYDEYFKDAASRVDLPPSSGESYAKPAAIAVARSVSGGRRIVNASHASWVNRAYYNKLMGGKTKAVRVSQRSLLETASAITGTPITDPSTALQILHTGSYGSRKYAAVPSLAVR